MDAREKAIELVEKFNAFVINTNEEGSYSASIENAFASKCALIAVDEIINSYDDCHAPILEGTFSLKDWQKVKEEIELLK